MPGVVAPIGRSACCARVPGGRTPQVHLQHFQSEVIAGARLRRRGITLPVPEVVVLIFDADFNLGESHRPEVRDEDVIAKCSDSRNRNRLDLVDQ